MASFTTAIPAAAGRPVRAPKSVCRMTVVGAGPSGLSVTAHLRGAGIETHTFGETMCFWRSHMPVGMNLRSAWGASSFSAPHGRFSLDEYAASGAIRRSAPIPLEDFVSYGEWFQRHVVPDLDPRKVLRVEHIANRFRLSLDDGETFDSQGVVIAVGLLNQEYFPEVFRGFSRELVSHTSNHADFGRFRGQRVAVVGRGQSAVESAALLAEAGADVEMICRGPIRWIGRKGAKSLLNELHAPSGVGPFPLDWLAEVPAFVRRWPIALREKFSRRCLRAAAAGWLAPRIQNVRVNQNRRVTAAHEQGSRLTLRLDNGARAEVDHVLLATGYVLDISKPRILSETLTLGIRYQPGTCCPVLSSTLESSVPGLYFAGSAAVPTHGPLLRFVAGVGYSATSITTGALGKPLRP